MNPQELQTFVNYGVKVKTFILNNHIYGITKAYQDKLFKAVRKPADRRAATTRRTFSKSCRPTGLKLWRSRTMRKWMPRSRKSSLRQARLSVTSTCMGPSHLRAEIFGWKTPHRGYVSPSAARGVSSANMVIEPAEGWMNPEYPDVVPEWPNTQP